MCLIVVIYNKTINKKEPSIKKRAKLALIATLTAETFADNPDATIPEAETILGSLEAEEIAERTAWTEGCIDEIELGGYGY